MLKTKIKTKIVFYVDSDDQDLKHCGYFDDIEHCARDIACNKMYCNEKFNNVDYDDDEEFEYFQKVENRFTRLLKYYLNPNKLNGLK